MSIEDYTVKIVVVCNYFLDTWLGKQTQLRKSVLLVKLFDDCEITFPAC